MAQEYTITQLLGRMTGRGLNAVKQYVDGKLASVYKVMGSASVATLNGYTSGEDGQKQHGRVWNVQDEGWLYWAPIPQGWQGKTLNASLQPTDDADTADTTPAYAAVRAMRGDNALWMQTDDYSGWDILSGTYDYSQYVGTYEQFRAALAAELENAAGLDTAWLAGDAGEE